MRVGVIGAGPAGLTAALSLLRGGAQVEVFEASEQVGGLSRSIELWGQRVDIGPHRFFSTNKQVNEFWLQIVGENYQMVDRLTRVYFRGELIDYPIRPLGALRQLGPVEAARCLLSYMRQKLSFNSSAKQEESFESWVTHRFGKRLFDVFFRSYSEKLWGIECSDLSADFAAQRIREFSLWEALRSAVSPSRGNHHKTLVDRFAYPIGGTGAVYDMIAQQIVELGGTIHTNTPVEKIIREQTSIRGIQTFSGETQPFDQIVSTMPLTKLVQGLDDEVCKIPTEICDAADRLKFRNTVLVYLNIDSDCLFDDQWLYLQSPDVLAGRITNFRNWTSDLHRESQTTILAVEQWCNDNDTAWVANDDELINHCTNELQQIGILKSQKVLGGHVIRIRRSYPVYQRGYQQYVQRIAEFLSEFNGITLIGRYGAFKYNNQDHSILMGLLAAENILTDANHNLWDINADFDRYQEQSLITESGLIAMSN